MNLERILIGQHRLDYRDWNVSGRHRHVAIIVLIILLPMAFILPARSMPIDVTLSPAQVTLRMNLSMRENITSLPLVNIDLDSAASKPIADHFTPALQRLV